MTWRSPRQSLLSRALRPRVRHHLVARWLTTLPVTTQSIASILALQSPDDHDAPRRVVVTGHVRTVRNQKRRAFVEIGDGSTIRSLQALLDPSQAARYVSNTNFL